MCNSESENRLPSTQNRGSQSQYNTDSYNQSQGNHNRYPTRQASCRSCCLPDPSQANQELSTGIKPEYGIGGVAASAVNFFITRHCNMRCRFCFAHFRDRQELEWPQVERLLHLLAEAGCRKITFVGGEPLCSPWLTKAITQAKRLNMTTGVVTNGALVTPAWVEGMAPALDWLGLSIDSVDPGTNRRIGRTVEGTPLPWVHYESLGKAVHRNGVRLKINTVVCAWNWRQDLSEHIPTLLPDRWKVFQALPIVGENDHQGNEFVVSDDQFADFRSRHRDCANTVFETNEAMRESYLMVSPDGRFFDNSTGKHRFSRCILAHGIDAATSDILFDSARFRQRGGVYDWKRR